MKYITTMACLVLLLFGCEKEESCTDIKLIWYIECNNCDLSVCGIDGCPIDLYIDGGLVSSLNLHSRGQVQFVPSQRFTVGEHAFMIKDGATNDVLIDYKTTLNCNAGQFENTMINY